jgi:CrcB protein
MVMGPTCKQTARRLMAPIQGAYMYLIVLVAIGGAIGAVGRFLLSGWVQDGILNFPLGTMAVNVLGCFFIGLVAYLSEYGGMFDAETRTFLTIGILGGFTTMSSFSYESFRLLENNELTLFSINFIGTGILCLLAVFLGKIIATEVIR